MSTRDHREEKSMSDYLMDVDTNSHLHKKRKRKKTIVTLDFEQMKVKPPFQRCKDTKAQAAPINLQHERAIQVLEKLQEHRLQLAEAHAKQRPVAAEYESADILLGFKRYHRDCERHYAKAKELWETAWAIEHAITTLKRCSKR